MIRAYFNIDDADIVLVSQEHGSKLGFPEFETNVVFWKAEKRYRMKIFSPVSDVSQADLPIIWLLPSLEDNGDIDCC
ncbi:MAG: hypothetical protein COA52_01685 [Hyphomicrobiales bacterium]|nr:hypothetical protein [Hyphomicrobiales bacterium]PCJ96428.1 MAG: hypothetical protein COA52_01685 [Hyphomicrobiales bacterium]